MDFENESDLDRLRWRCHTWLERSTEFAPQGEYGLKAELPPGIYPSVEMLELPGNWSGYGALAFWVHVPEKLGENIHVRIDDPNTRDDYFQRYNGVFKLEESPKRICIDMNTIVQNPKKGLLDIRHVERIIFFLYKQNTKTTLYLDDIRLVESCTP